MSTTLALPAPPPAPWSFSSSTVKVVSQSTKARVAAIYSVSHINEEERKCGTY